MQTYKARKLDYRAPTMAEMVARASAFETLMDRRRTVRDFCSRPVPRQIIETAIRTAASAPSGANQQPWTFAAISDSQLKRQIRLAAELEEQEFYKGRAGQQWLEALAHLGTDWHKPFLETAPWLIAIFGQRWGVDANGARIKHYYVPESIGIAAGILITALHNAGLATLTHTPSPMGFLNDICDRPENEKPYILLVAGFPDEDCQVPVITKKSLSDVAVWL